MRKTVSIITVMMVVCSMMLFVGGCKKKTGVSGATAELFALLPANSNGVLAINFKKVAGLPIFDTMIKGMEDKMKTAKVEVPQVEPAPEAEAETTTTEVEEGEASENAAPEGEAVEQDSAEGEAATEEAPVVPAEPDMFENYADFVQKTGIDPKKDIVAIVIALTGNASMTDTDPNALILIQLTYNKNTIMNLIKSKGAKYTEEAYNGIAMYKTIDAKGKEQAFAFINDKTIAAGNPEGLKQVIDLSKGTGKSIMTNEAMAPHFKKFKSDAIAAFVLPVPADLKKPIQSPMMKMDLSKAEAFTGYFDYSGSAYVGELALINKDKAANEQLVATLNGFKAMAGIGGPEFVELANNITLSADSESILLKISITEELFKKMEKKMSEKKPGPMGM